MREITPRAVVLGILLTAVLAAANAYLGLFAGMTVSASIPAAVISMGILAALGRGRGTNILENNMVQTSASAGESLAAGVIFTVPALILMGVWTEFNYWQVAFIAALGGTLGVLFCIPLRRAFIVDSKELTFPEGLATAEVLKTGERGGSGAKEIAVAGILGAVFKFFQSGMHAWGEAFEGAKILGGKWLGYVGTNLSPALIAVGYIVGRNIGILVFLGGALAWLVGLPLWISFNWEQAFGAGTVGSEVLADPVGTAYGVWSTKIRYMGVGAMAVGGLWALLKVIGPVIKGIQSGMRVFAQMGAGQKDLPREERNIPMPWVLKGVAVLIIPVALYYYNIIGSLTAALIMSIMMILAGFLFSAVAGYMGGLVGSSNNPISGITIATLLATAFLLKMVVGGDFAAGPTAAILVAAIVASAASIGSDVLQDLKAGNLVNATPWRQEVMEIVGVGVAALCIAPVLNLLHGAYGIGSAQLSAPQASLMASVASGVFGGGLPWDLVAIGAVVAAVIIMWDQYLAGINSQFRAPVLAVAVGIYLPLELSVPIFAGGMINHFVHRPRRDPDDGTMVKRGSPQRGVLVASGLITGEALVGILIAGLIVGKANLPDLSTAVGAYGPLVGFAALAAVAVHLIRRAAAPPTDEGGPAGAAPASNASGSADL